jgi:hypothetical protein
VSGPGPWQRRAGLVGSSPRVRALHAVHAENGHQLHLNKRCAACWPALPRLAAKLPPACALSPRTTPPHGPPRARGRPHSWTTIISTVHAAPPCPQHACTSKPPAVAFDTGACVCSAGRLTSMIQLPSVKKTRFRVFW